MGPVKLTQFHSSLNTPLWHRHSEQDPSLRDKGCRITMSLLVISPPTQGMWAQRRRFYPRRACTLAMVSQIPLVRLVATLYLRH